MNSKFWLNAHLILAVAWALMVPAVFVFGLWESVAFVVFASIYANFIGHWSAWQARRAEVMSEENPPMKEGDAK